MLEFSLLPSGSLNKERPEGLSGNEKGMVVPYNFTRRIAACTDAVQSAVSSEVKLIIKSLSSGLARS